MKNLYLITGPSGVGKTSVANKLCETHNLKQLFSYTDRPPRHEGETGHVFLSRDEFNDLGPIFAGTVFDGHRYGTTANQLEEHDVYVVDLAGIQYIKEHYTGPKGIVAIGLSAPAEVLSQRMKNRGDSEDAVAQRLAHDERVFVNLNSHVNSTINCSTLADVNSLAEFVYHGIIRKYELGAAW
jgi:Guanylate kinase